MKFFIYSEHGVTMAKNVVLELKVAVCRGFRPILVFMLNAGSRYGETKARTTGKLKQHGWPPR